MKQTMKSCCSGQRTLIESCSRKMMICSSSPHGGSKRDGSFAGLIYSHQLGPGIGSVIEDLELVSACTREEEVRNRLIYLPLR